MDIVVVGVLADQGQPIAGPGTLFLLGCACIALGFVFGTKSAIQSRLRMRGREPLLPRWLPGGWWARNPTTGIATGIVTIAVGLLLWTLAIVRRLT
jgi:hypothetical protein